MQKFRFEGQRSGSLQMAEHATRVLALAVSEMFVKTVFKLVNCFTHFHVVWEVVEGAACSTGEKVSPQLPPARPGVKGQDPPRVSCLGGSLIGAGSCQVKTN